MHAAAFASLGLGHRYLAFHVDAASLAPAIGGARALGFGGLNLTVPHKVRAAALCDELSASARRIGAVNTIAFFAGSRVFGDNTDAPGFAAAVGEMGDAAVEQAVVLGGGGAALAVIDALMHDLRAEEVRWVSRDPAALRAAVAARPSWARVQPLDYAELATAPRTCDLLVNCTTVGMRGGPAEFPVALDGLRAGTRVIDVVYPRPAGGLLDRAEAAGCVVQDGLAMLLWQGVRALELWLARPLPPATIAAMRAALTP
jgi:shikimate dehydrogenase